MNHKALTDKAVDLKATVAQLSSTPQFHEMMGQERTTGSANGWWEPDYEHFKVGTLALFGALKCIATTSDGVSLLDHAATSLLDDVPIFNMRPEMPHGFLYLEKPIQSGPDLARAYFWLTTPDSSKPGRHVLLIATIGPNFEYGYKNWAITPQKTLASAARDMADLDADSRESALFDLRLVIAFNLLLEQKVTEQITEHPSRHARRRAERVGIELDPVLIVRLPHREYHHGDADGSAIDWSHRWVVGGHWRKQWYPSQELHKPKWIAPYVKGPDDKPLLVKDKRYLFDP